MAVTSPSRLPAEASSLLPDFSILSIFFCFFKVVGFLLCSFDILVSLFSTRACFSDLVLSICSCISFSLKILIGIGRPVFRFLSGPLRFL